MAESGEIIQNGIEVAATTSNVGSWSLGCDITIEDANADIQEIRVDDIVLSGSVSTEVISVDIDSDLDNVMDLDVLISLDGVKPFIVESQVVPYDDILEITDNSPETTAEKRYAASARSAKEIHDYVSEVDYRSQKNEGDVKVLDKRIKALEDMPAGEGGGDGYWYKTEEDEAEGKKRIHADYDIFVHGHGIFDGDVTSTGPGDTATSPGGGASISSLSDVSLDGLKGGDLLVFDNETNRWLNTPQSQILPEMDDYVTKEDFEAIDELWRLDGEDRVVTAKPVVVNNDLIVNGDVASIGTADSSTQAGVTAEEVLKILEDNGYATVNDIAASIAALINGAPTTLDTLGEIALAFQQSQNIVSALNDAIGSKANTSELSKYLLKAGDQITGAIRANGISVVEDTSGNGILGVNLSSGAWSGVSGGDAFGTVVRQTTIRSNGNLYHYNHSKAANYKILTTLELSDANITALKSLLGKISVDSSGNVVINTNLIVNGDTSSK